MNKKNKQGAQRGFREIPAAQLVRVSGGEAASDPPETSGDLHIDVSTKNLMRDRF